MSQPTAPIKVRVGGVLIHTIDGEPKVLLVRQNNRPFWVLPGGTLEWGETLEECLIREIQEEVGIHSSINSLIDVSTWLHTDDNHQVVKHVIDVFYSLNYLDGPIAWAPPHPENINDIQWLSFEDLANLNLMPLKIKSHLLNLKLSPITP